MRGALVLAGAALALIGLAAGSAWASTLDISPAANVTNTGDGGGNGYYERDPQLLMSSGGTWYLIYSRSQTMFTPGGNPDLLKYDIYYQTSTDQGGVWSAAVKVLDAVAIGANANFRSATVCEADGRIWVIGADVQNLEGDIYANSYSGGSWSGQAMIFDGTYDTGAFHVCAVSEGDDIRLFYGVQHESRGVAFIKYHGDTDSWDAAVTYIGASAGWQIPRVIKEGGTYYLVSTDWGHILFSKTDTPDTVPWPAAIPITTAPPGGASSDPAIVRYGSSEGTDDLIVFHAPWYADDSQPQEYVYSTDAGSTWSSSTPFTDAYHSPQASWDMMPRACMKDAGTVLSFFGMETRGINRGQADIVAVSWDLGATVGHAHYTTVKDGIDNASAGDVLDVGAGLYPERLTINKSLTLLGAQDGVDPTQPGARTNPAAESTIDIAGLSVTNPNVAVEIPAGVTNVTISGFTLIGSPTWHYADEAVVRFWDDNITIRENIVNGYFGALQKGNDYGSILRNRFVINKVGVTFQPNPGTYLTVSGNSFARGTSPASDAAAIYLTGLTHGSVTGNTATAFPGSNGLGGSNLTDVTASGNTFDGCRKGVNFWGTTTFVTVSGNTIRNSVEMGVNIKGQDIEISGNTIENNPKGIVIDKHVLETRRVDLEGNRLSGNTINAVEVTAAVLETVEGTCNWWGDANGPDVPPGNPNPPGETFSGNLSWIPWLTSPGGACDGYGANHVAADVTGLCVSSAHPCVTVPVVFTRADTTPARGLSATFALSSNLELCGSVGSSILQGSWLSGYARTFQVVDNGGGSYTVDQAIMGLPCGVTTGGTVFTVDVRRKAGEPDGVGTLTVTSVLVRNCSNAPLAGLPGAPGDLPIDFTPPVAVTDLAAAQVKSLNDSDGTTKVTLTFTLPPTASVVEVYRAGYGQYPEYDDAGGAVPVTPSYAPGSPWALTSVVASGQTDETTARDYWYYVMFTKDACGNVSAVSNKAGGVLNYHLGDVSNGVTAGQGDNLVATADISLLGSHYGITLVPSDPYNYLDVGPTTNWYVDGRPLTDNHVGFEDLMMFAINYGQVSKTGGPMVEDLGGSLGSGMGLEAEVGGLLVRSGAEFEVPVVLRAGDKVVQGIRTDLVYDPAQLEYLGASSRVAGQHFFKDLPSSGRVEMSLAMLGEGGGLTGEGEVIGVRLRALRGGAVMVGLESTSLRGVKNQELLGSPAGVGEGIRGGAREASLYRLGEARPNPFGTATVIPFELGEASEVEVSVYDVAGRWVRTLVSGARGVGEHEATWDGRDAAGRRVSSGIYFYGMRANGWQSQKQLTLLK